MNLPAEGKQVEMNYLNMKKWSLELSPLLKFKEAKGKAPRVTE